MDNDINEVMKENEKLIYKISSKFYGIDKEDLYQVGVIGLIKAHRNFKNNKSAKFSTYAYDYIFGEMYNLSLSKGNIKLNKETLRLCKKIEEARRSLTQIINRIPNNYELASFLEIDVKVINNALSATMNILSIDEEREVNFYETIPDKNQVKIDDSLIINESMVVLNDDEKEIINLRYFKDLSQSETAVSLGMTQASVSRYEKKSLQKMGEYISA